MKTDVRHKLRIAGVALSVILPLIAVGPLVFSAVTGKELAAVTTGGSETAYIAYLVALLVCFLLAGPLDCLKLFRKIAFAGFAHGGIFGTICLIATLPAACLAVEFLPMIFTIYALVQAKKRGEGEARSAREEEERRRYRERMEEMHEKVDDIHDRMEDVQETARDTNETVHDTNRTARDTNERVRDVQDKLEEVLHFLKTELQKILSEEKDKLQAAVSELRSGEDEEPLLEEYYKKMTAYIDSRLRLSAGDVMLKKEEAYLSSLFGREWKKMQEGTRSSLVSAAVMWQTLSDVSDDAFDYSGICILAVSALENELRKYFFTDFITFETNRYGSPRAEKEDWEKIAEKWDAALLHKKSCTNARKGFKKEGSLLKEDFMLGSFKHLLRPRQDITLERGREKETAVRELNDYLRTILIDADADNPADCLTKAQNGQKSFVDQCDAIRKMYRNNAAHAGNMSKEMAHGCYRDVICEPGVSRAEAVKVNLEVMGVLYRLMTMVKPA